jgi:hypothetical protein
MHSYQRLRDLREDADKKQEELAIVLNVSLRPHSRFAARVRITGLCYFLSLDKK